MNKSIFARFFLLSILLIITGGCAKVSTPSGGRKDRIPPAVITSVPENGTKNFRNKSLTVTFDEYIVLDNINDKFMVSPPMKKKPRVYIKGKSVNIEFEDIFKDSTTYTFYFLDAIRDLNEGNILDNYQFVFSTGPVIDSLSVTGNVYKSFNLEVPEKTQVLLYRKLADSAVIKDLPEYISRVDQNGYFRIDNVRPGKYRLYALKDDDNSKNYNRPEEEFGFNDSLITVTPEKNFIPIVKDTTSIKKIEKKAAKKEEIKIPEPVILNGEYKLVVFTAPKKNHYLTKSARDVKYQLTYILSLPPDSMKVEFSIPGTGKDKYFIEESRYRDTLKVWLKDSTLYAQPQISTIVKYPFTDTLGVLGYKEDTIPMRFVSPRAPRVVKVKKAKLKVENNISGGFLKPGQTVVFKSQTPFSQPDTTRIKLFELIEKEKKRVSYQLLKDSTNSLIYVLKAKWLKGKKYLFIADSASFGNIYNEYSDSTGIQFSFRDPESYGKLTLDISNCEGACIIQLLDNTEKLVAVAKISKNGKVEFPLLEGGRYRVRVIYDLNGDGQWTTGDFMSGRQPEPVSYYKEELEMKTNFFVDNKWDIKMKNFKEQKLKEKPKTR